jgi:hypothetical protein
MGEEGVGNTGIREPKVLSGLKMTAAAVAAIGTIAGGAFGLYHWVTGNNDSGGGSAIAEKGTVESVSFTPQGTSGTVDARVHVLGAKGKNLQVVWTLIDAERSRPVQEPGFQAQPVATFKPTSEDSTREFSARIPAPLSTATDLVFVRVQFLDESKQELDHADTDMFRLGGGPSG